MLSLLFLQEGFDTINPYIPVEVHNYTEHEVNVAIDYLIETNWIQHQAYRTSDSARRELIFLSAKNPHYLDLATRNL